VAAALDSVPQCVRRGHYGEEFPRTIRKLLTLGASYGITIPTRWVRSHLHPSTPYVTADFSQPGIIIIRPLRPNELPDHLLSLS